MKLEEVNLSKASLVGANLSKCNLKRANLSYANLTEADLSMALLIKADLKFANLQKANLFNAYLMKSNLSNSILTNSILLGARLQEADLKDAVLDESEKIRKGLILNEDWTAFKICRDGRVVELLIPKGSIVYSINNSKCRTNKVKVVSITNADNTVTYDTAYSKHSGKFIYEVNQEIEIEHFDLRYNIEGSSGIHFYRTREEAIKHYLGVGK